MTGTIAYLAHPLAGDRDNLRRALLWLRCLSRAEPAITFIAPWIAAVLSGEDDDDEAARARGLAHDVVVVKRCDMLVCVGGRISRGMQVEVDAARAAGKTVLDLTHLGVNAPSGELALVINRDQSATLITTNGGRE